MPRLDVETLEAFVDGCDWLGCGLASHVLS